jgi:AraC-like DNA-binding protein
MMNGSAHDFWPAAVRPDVTSAERGSRAQVEDGGRLLGRFSPRGAGRDRSPTRGSASITARRTIVRVNSRPAETQRLRDLAGLRRVRDRIDREYAQPLDVEALARGAHMSAGHLSREFRLAYGDSPYGYPMTRRIERAMALLRRGDLSVTEVCSAVGYSSLGTFSTRFTELVGVPPSTYRHQTTRATAGMPSCVAKQATKPVRNREAPVTEVT